MEFIVCDECGKRLIVKNSDGSLHFVFGKKYESVPPVDIKITGYMEMVCIRSGCNHLTKIGSKPK